ncbi:YisL family protein [Salirhabdus sp. Marseille-P4669]|uniref:YisL family protein n=1 Tax=Salirhabdus sp. Marseille-P4669 TaxID=2042310 RepID=UPI000C7A8F5F|nr:YisL family protein [Salirhabdus sp. Marseille-P4669]
MTHLHITAWALALILFLVAYFLQKQGKEKPAKIVQMILRLDYLLVLYSGGDLLTNYSSVSGAMLGEVITKVVAGILVIAALEMILVKGAKGKSTTVWWIILLIALIIAMVLGFVRLPLTV